MRSSRFPLLSRRHLLPAAVLAALLGSCVAAGVAAGAAAGVWAYDEHSDDSGHITLGWPAEEVYAVVQEVAASRGSNLESSPHALRLQCEVDGADVTFTVFPVPGAERACELKVRARGLLGRGELAKDLAVDVQYRLEKRGY